MRPVLELMGENDKHAVDEILDTYEHSTGPIMISIVIGYNSTTASWTQIGDTVTSTFTSFSEYFSYAVS